MSQLAAGSRQLADKKEALGTRKWAVIKLGTKH